MTNIKIDDFGPRHGYPGSISPQAYEIECQHPDCEASYLALNTDLAGRWRCKEHS